MKITIQLNSNNLFDIKLKRAKELIRIYNATEKSIKKYCYNPDLCSLLINKLNEMINSQEKLFEIEIRKIKFI